MSASAQRRLWLALWAVALAAGCDKRSSEAPAPAAPASREQKAQPLSAGTCEGVEPTGMAPGWKVAPVQASGPGSASASFSGTAGERAILVVRETGAPAQGFRAEAKLNGGDRVSASSRNPLAAKVVELQATNGLDLSVDAGGARASVAALALPPCTAVDARATHAGGKTPTVETRAFTWAVGAGPALLVIESGGAKRVKGRAVLGTVEVRAPNGNQGPAVEVVTPQASNTLRVEVEGDAGAWVRVAVLEPDMLPPVVSMEQPTEGARLDSTPVEARGTAVEGAVAVKVGTVEAVLSQGQYTARVPLEEGPNALVAEARDQCGNVARVCRSVVLEARPPVLVIEGVTEGQVSREPLSPTWRVQSSGPATVEAKLDGAPFASGTPVSAEGAHELVVVARDGAGRETAARVGFAIDTTAPLLTLSGVEEGQRRNTPAVLSYTVEETHPGTVEATLDGAPMSSGDIVAAEGAHEWVVVATDVAGNRSEARRRFVVDLTPPTLEVLAPAPGSYTQADTIEVVVVAGDAGPLAGVWLGSTELMLGADGKHRGNVPLEEGSNLLVLVARDVAGNGSRSTLVVTKDATAPQLTVTTPAEGAKVAGTVVQVEGQVLDATPLQVRVAGQAVAVGADGRFQHAVSVAQGAVSVQVVATDAAGNTASLVRGFRANSTPPRLELTAPASGTVTEEPSIEVSGFARAADRTDTVKLEVAGGEHSVRADGGFSVQVPLALGSNTVSVTAVDGYGLRTTRTVRVERQGPREPGPGLPDGGSGGGTPDGGGDAPDGGEGTPDGGSPLPTPDGGLPDEPPALVLASPEEDSLWGVERVSVLGRVVGGTLPLQVTVDGLPAAVAGRQFSAALALPEGSTVLLVRAVDALGRVAEARRRVKVDQTPPFLEVTRPEQAETTVSESPYRVEGLAGDAYLGGVTVNGSPVLVLAGRFSASVPLVAGANTVEVVAVDLAGNRSRATRTLTVEGVPPRLTVLEPAEGSESLTAVVRVTMQVRASAPLAEVRIGTGLATEAGPGQYTAQVPLALGENVIPLSARDTLGLTGMSSVRVRYRDPTTEPLVVTGVDPSDQAMDLEPDTLVNVAFNKPVQPESARAGFTVSANGAPLPGGWSVAYGGQTVSFIARDPLPEGATLQVRVAGVAPEQGPGMEGEFRSVFTVRRPLTRLRGQVVDEQREPLSGVRVEVEGQGLYTRTGADGNWALFGVQPGRVVLRYEGGSSADGRAYPTVRRRFAVEAERDNEESTVMLTPVDAESAEPVDTSRPLHLTFGGRHGALEVDIPAGGLTFAGGSARGLVTATELSLHALPVPVEGSLRPAAVWQLQPAGTRLLQPVELRLPNRLPQLPGSQAVLFTYDPDEHVLRPVGLASFSEDGTRLVSEGAFEAGSLEYFGYLPLPEEASAALAGASGTHLGPLSQQQSLGLVSIFFGNRFGPILQPILVRGTVEGPREQAVAIEISQPTLGVEQRVTLDERGLYRMPLSAQARSLIPPPPGSPPESLVITLEGTSGSGQRLGPPSGTSWRQESPDGQRVELPTEVELSQGTSSLFIAGTMLSGRKVERLTAELSLTDAGVPDGGPIPALLRVQRANAGSSGVAEETSGVVRFSGLPVRVSTGWGEGVSITRETGEYTATALALQARWLPGPFAVACVPLPIAYRVQSWVGTDGRVQTRKTPNYVEECSGVVSSGSGSGIESGNGLPYAVEPVDVTIDVRWLHGTVTLVDRNGQPLPAACSPELERDGAEVVGLSQDDVRSTEVHFFREDDPATPLVSYAVAHPESCEGSTTRPHGRYAKVRYGPSSTIGRMQASRLNGQRLLAGDRLVVFAINHATGYSGMEIVTIPAVNRSARAPDGSCPPDDAAGGPMSVRDGARMVSLSRCTLQDLGILANVKLYPPEIDVRVARSVHAEGVQTGPQKSFIRHGGGATTRDAFVSVDTHWRVRRKPRLGWDAGVLEPADPSCDGGVGLDGGSCKPQRLFDEGPRGRLLEYYCSELPQPRTPEQQALCLSDDSELANVPAGVPPLAGRVVRITGSAVEQPAVASFPIAPGRSTSTVQTALRRRERDGTEVMLNNLTRANYYVQVVGHPVLPRDRNQNGTIEPSEENAPPPDFADGTSVPGLPERAVALKNVYSSVEPEGRLDRYDRAREHEFRVRETGAIQVTAITAGGQRPMSGGGAAGSPPAASTDDLSYQFLLSLIEPEDPGRAGTIPGEYVLRLGTDSFGIECPIVLDTQQNKLSGTCEGEYLPDVLSAGDVLYLQVYLRGNAANALSRFTFNGLSMREDYVGAASKFTAERAVEASTDGKPVEDRPISRLNEAHFFIGPHELTAGRIRLCTSRDCSGTNAVIKDATLQWSGLGRYQVTEAQGGIAPAALIQGDMSGTEKSRHFRLGLPASLTQMPGNSASRGPAEIFLVKDIQSPVPRTEVEPLGRPKGRFQGLHAQAPGQQAVAGLNLAALSLSFTHTDFTVPQLAEEVSFSRTYVNQSDLPSAVGVGWRHNLDGFVLEEHLGRYVVGLGSQSWGFIRCAMVDRDARTASGCVTDKTHGMELEVNGTGVQLTTEQGWVYRFELPAVKWDKEGRRKWLLTKFHDGRGRGEQEGWTHLSYAENSNRLKRVARTPGVLSLELAYCDDFTVDDCEGIPPDAQGLLKHLARSEDFKLLKAVTLKSGSLPLHVVRFKHDKWGNLLEAERTTDPPAQKWKYTYAPIPSTVAPDKASRAANELASARFEVEGQAQWIATYDRGGAKCYAHLEPFECVSEVKQTGFLGNPFKIGGEPDSRTLSLPTGTSAQVALNEYGNITSSAVGGQPARQLTWPSSTRGGEVRLEKSVSPGGRTLKYGADSRMRLSEVKAEGASDVAGLGTGSLVSVAARDARGLPTAGQLATANGPASWSMARSTAGDVKGLTVEGTTLFSRETDDDGRVISETDALGNTTTYSFGKLGLPVTAEVSAGSVSGGLSRYTLTMEYDDFGRMVRRANGATGAAETWRYDGQGNVLEYTQAGQPAERWTYTYTYGDQQLTVLESLLGVSYTRTAVFTEGLLTNELLSYGAGSAARTYEYEGGRLKKKTDELSTVWEYTYDSAGRLKTVKANGQLDQEYGLDTDGNVTSVKDREERTVAIGNDSLGQPISWTYEDGYQEKVKRDARGAIVWQEVVSPGVATSRSFDHQVDSLGRVLTRRSAGGGPVNVISTYDTAGRVRTREDLGTGLRESFEYGDALGRVTRHELTVQSKAGPLSRIETRRYQDSEVSTTVWIRREIATGTGTREENQTLVMDALGRVLSDERPGAGTAVYTYDARGNVLTRQHSVLGITSYTYNGLGHLLSKVEPGGVITTYTVDALGRVLTQQGPHEEESWTFSYDVFNRPLTRVLAQAGSTPAASWTFDYPGNGLVHETDPLSVRTSRHFNSRQLLLKEVRDSRTTEYAYDGTWPRLQRVSHEGSELELTRSFDDLGRPLSEVERWGQGGQSYTYSTSTTWQGRRGTRSEQWDATGAPRQTRTSQLELDGLGNLVEREQGGLTDAWTYDAAGALAIEALAGRPEKRLFYEQDRLSRVEYGAETTFYGYDAGGRLKRETDPSGRVRVLDYNAQGLVERETFGLVDTLETAYTYDRGGFPRTMTRGGQEWTFTHGPRGELRSVKLPAGFGIFTYRYDALLRLTQLTPPHGGGAVEQTFLYDSFDRQRQRTRGSSLWATVWQGGLSTTNDPNGDIVERLQDSRGRVVKESFRPGTGSRPFNDLAGVTYAYDGLNQLLSAQESRASGNVSNAYEYDARSRLMTMRRGSDTVRYTYTASGQRQTVTSPSGTVRYEYDAQDRVKGIQSSQGPIVTVGWERGGLLSEVMGDGIVERYTYWGHGLVRTITSSWGGPSAGSQRYEYTYDTRGNRLQELYTGPGATLPELTRYIYDQADRLTEVHYPTGESERYLLAPDGSRLDEWGLQGNASQPTKHWRYSYDTSGGLERIDNLLTGGEEARIITDPGGRVISEVRGGTTRQYGWDAGGRLAWIRRMTPQENVEASYTYGFDGLRRSRTVAGVGTRYVWGANEELLEEGPTAGAGLLYARADFGAVAAGGERLLRDALGSVVGRVGTTANLSRYGAWGALRQGDAPDPQGPTLAYAGQHFDSEVGLNYAQQRWYSADWGRFLSEDPLFGTLKDPASLQGFVYANANPLRYTDPNGLRSATPQESEHIDEFERLMAHHRQRVAEKNSVSKTWDYLIGGDSAQISRIKNYLNRYRRGIELAAEGERVLPFPDYNFPKGAWSTEVEGFQGESIGIPSQVFFLPESDYKDKVRGRDLLVRLDARLSSPVGTVASTVVMVAGGDQDTQDKVVKAVALVEGLLPSLIAIRSSVGTSTSPIGAGKHTQHQYFDKHLKPRPTRNLHDEAVAARDALAAELALKNHIPAVVVGAYSPSTGRVTAGASLGSGRGCAEGVCAGNLGHPADVKFTRAVRPRTGKYFPVCEKCEATYGRGAFPDPETVFKTDKKGQ